MPRPESSLPPSLPYFPTQREIEIMDRLRDLADKIQGADDHRKGYGIAAIHGITLRPEMTLAEAAAQGLRHAITHIYGRRSGGF